MKEFRLSTRGERIAGISFSAAVIVCFGVLIYALRVRPALMLVCARLHHEVSTVWGTKRYMSMKALNELHDTMSSAG